MLACNHAHGGAICRADATVQAVGVEDWRVLLYGACAHSRTGSFAAGVALVDAIGRLADESGR